MLRLAAVLLAGLAAMPATAQDPMLGGIAVPGYAAVALAADGKMKAIGVTSGMRQKGIDVPTLKEQGINIELGNWRGVYGAAGITDAQKKALVDMIVKATKSKSWMLA